MGTEHKRTGFRFDMMPWKLVFCDKSWIDCEKTDPDCELSGIRIRELPGAPEPGRIPKGTDHLHIVQKYSGERDAREEEKWRSLVFGTARCDHGRLQEERCRGCKGWTPNAQGLRIGTTREGKPIVIPARDDMGDIKNWIQGSD